MPGLKTVSAEGRREGFTLIELLVVIAIIGVLVGLLLPAVQQAREAARRSACSNNCKQLGLGLHNFHDANKKFPPSGFLKSVSTGRSVPADGLDRNYSTWLTLLLPFLEESTLYDGLDASQPLYGSSPQPIVSSQVRAPCSAPVTSSCRWDRPVTWRTRTMPLLRATTGGRR